MIVRQFLPSLSNINRFNGNVNKQIHFKIRDFRFLLIVFFALFFTNAFNQKTYYIDPSSNGNSQNGTKENPFKSVGDFKWENGSIYLLKSATTLKTNSTLSISGDNLTFGSYGEGARPIILSTDPSTNRVIVIRGSNNKVMNLDVRARDASAEQCAGAVIDMIGANNPTLENCKTTGGVRGINISKTTGIARVINCFITDTWDDGMYNRENETIIIENTHVERVNLKFHINPDQTYAGGDGIQFDFVDHFEIRNCTVDKTYTGGKFFIIADHFDTGIIENTKMTGGMQQNGVYLGQGNSLIYRNNYLSGSQIGLWNKTSNVDVYYNVFKNTGQEAYSGAVKTYSKIYNNTFVHCNIAIKAWNENIKLYNNIFYENGKDFEGNRSMLDADFNCYFPSKANNTELHSISADPLFNNPSSDDYSLKSGSPCIDKGKVIQGISLDHQGTLIPSGSTTDIGSFEFTNGASSKPVTNNAPVIKLKYEKSVYGGKVITLDASESVDPDKDKLSYTWVSNNDIQLSTNNSSKVSFLSPDVTSVKTISFKLSVSDGKTSKSSDISIDVRPYKPEIQRINIPAVEASTFENPNYPENAVDNNIQTRWSAEGDNNWLKINLAKEAQLSHLKVAYYGGNRRIGYFDLCGSIDNVNWEPILENASTCGYSENKEVFEIPENMKYNEYKFIRLTGHSNSENSWNSIAEVSLYGYSTGIEDKTTEITDSFNNKFSIYPNPSSGEINLSFSENNDNEINAVLIYSMDGKAVFKKVYGIKTNELHFNHNLIDGVYFIQVQYSDNTEYTEKLLVKRQ